MLQDLFASERPSPSARGLLRVYEAILAVPREAVRENGPGGEPGVVAEDSPGPGAMNDPIVPDRMPADGEPRPERIGHFPEIRSELMRPEALVCHSPSA